MTTARIIQIVGWILFTVSLLAGLFGVFGGPVADNYPWLAVCIIAWIMAMFVLAFARRLRRSSSDDQS